MARGLWKKDASAVPNVAAAHVMTPNLVSISNFDKVLIISDTNGCKSHWQLKSFDKAGVNNHVRSVRDTLKLINQQHFK